MVRRQKRPNKIDLSNKKCIYEDSRLVSKLPSSLQYPAY